MPSFIPSLRLTALAGALGLATAIAGFTGSAAAATWQPPVEVAGSYSGSALPSNPSPWLAGDPLGGVTLATLACRPYDSSAASLQECYGNTASGAVPLLSDTLSDGGWQDQQGINGTQPSSSNPYDGSPDWSVGVGANGDAVVVWTAGGFGANGIWASQRVSGTTTWSAPIHIADPVNTYSSEPRVAVDKDGNATIAWLDGDDSSGHAVDAVSLAQDGTLGTAHTIADQGTTSANYDGLSMSGNADGDVLLAWRVAGQQYPTVSSIDPGVQAASFTPSGGWGAVQTLDNQDPNSDGNQVGQDGMPVTAIDAAGHGTVAWRTGRPFDSVTSAGVYTKTQGSSGTWPANAMSVPDSNFATVVLGGLVSDDAGDLTLAWSETGSLAGTGDNNSYARAARLAAGASGWTDQTLASGSSQYGSPASTAPAVAVNAAGDAVVAWSMTGCTQTFCGTADLPYPAVRAALAPAGESFGSPTTLTTGGESWEAGGGYASGNGTPPIQAAIDSSGIATVAWGATGQNGGPAISATSDGTPSGGPPPPKLAPTPPRTEIKACTPASGTMPKVIGLEEDAARLKLAEAGVTNVTVIERALRTPPAGVSDVGQVFAETPKPGAIVRCTARVRLVIYGGPTGLSVRSYKKLRKLVGEDLIAARDLTAIGWKIDYHFEPAAVDAPKITGTRLLSGKEVQLDVSMPEDQSRLSGKLFHGGPGQYKVDIPSVGVDNALSADMKNLFGETVWAGAVPVSATLVVDTHEAGNAEDPSDNLVGYEQSATSPPLPPPSPGWPVEYLKQQAHFTVTPTKAGGHVYVVAFFTCPASPDQSAGTRSSAECYAMDSMPVVRRTGNFDAMNGFVFDEQGVRVGPIPGTKGLARDASAGAARARAAGDCSDIGCQISRFVFWVQHPQNWFGETTIGAGQQPPPPSVVGTDGNLADVKPGVDSAPRGNPVYDAKLDLYPIADSKTTGLPPGRMYVVKNGQAVDLIDGSVHSIIAAGSANLHEGEVFGVYGRIIAAGSANIIAAGSANFVPQWPVLDANAYRLDPGLYEINRENGQIVARQVHPDGSIIAAGSANIIAAGSANIIAAGSANLTDGDYNVIAAGGGNIDSSGHGNVIDYNALLSLMPEVMGADQAAESAIQGTAIPTSDEQQLGAEAQGGNYQLIPALAAPGKAVAPSGAIIAAGSANIIAAGSANIIAAGSANIIAAGSANIVAAGSGNIISAGSAN